MEFGVFYQLPCGDDQSASQRYADTIAQCRLADTLGFDNVWLAELHFHSTFSITPSPLLLASAIAQTTQRIKLGVAVNLMPLHHPIHLAEDIATLDVISGGRALLGVGRGIIPSHFEGFGVSMDESRQGFNEALELVIQAWTKDDINFVGEKYQVRDISVAPKPIQKPHPPVHIASTGPDTFELVGAMGYHLLVAPVIVGNERAVEGAKTYRQKLAENGHDPALGKVSVTLPIFVSESRDRNRLAPLLEETVNSYIATVHTMMTSPAAHRAAKVSPRIAQMQEGLGKLNYKQILAENAVAGSPEECIERLNVFQEMYGAQEYSGWFNIGGRLPHEEVVKSMQLFADKVMPHFR
jgi:alkanesulfonate monooxygenase SsuD/methylene tetrahydromethanopterin reductase-like flavin-dependent oxidoreductase (luciferase family)